MSEGNSNGAQLLSTNSGEISNLVLMSHIQRKENGNV